MTAFQAHAPERPTGGVCAGMRIVGDKADELSDAALVQVLRTLMV